MPQPYKPREKDGQMSLGPRCVEQRPACAIKIAAIASTWTSLEGHMAMLFGGVTGQTEMTAADTVSHRANFAAQAALGAVQNLRMRIEVFKAATDTILTEQERAEFEDLITDMRGRARERNNVVHGRWAIVEKHPNDLILSASTWAQPNKWLRYSPADFENIIVRIQQLEERLVQFGARHTWGRMSALMPLPTLDPPESGPQGE